MRTDITELKRSLASQADAVAKMLLPDGKKEGSEWVHDPGTGKIKIELKGTKAGVWSHFGGDGGGDLIDLWMYATGKDLKDTLDDIRDYLGIQRPAEPHGHQREWAEPVSPRVTRARTSAAWTYLTDERGIPDDQLVAYRFGVMEDRESVAFPFYDDQDNILLVKKRLCLPGERPRPTNANCQPILMGWHLVGKCRRICIVEGELDAPSGAALLAGTDWDMPVLSVPFGGGSGNKQQWVENDWLRLEAVEEVFLALDNDAEGDTACEEISKRIGRFKCKRVRLPSKDMNECLLNKQHEEVVQAFDDAEEMDPAMLKRATDFISQVTELFYPDENTHVGYTLPFPKTHGRFLCRPGDLTIWSGDSGSGKSQILSYCVPWWVKHGSVLCAASLEMPAPWLFNRMVKQAGGVSMPSRDYIDRCMRWYAGNNEARGELLVYDLVGKANLEELLDVFTYARMKYGADQFIIDSLMRLGISKTDLDAQEQAIYQLMNWTLSQGVHVHLVAHNRKPQSEGQHQGQHGVAGAMEIAANACNQMEVVRLRSVERVKEKEASGRELSEKEQQMLERPGVLLHCNKQRHGGWEGLIPLWFDNESLRYRGTYRRPMHDEVFCE